MERRREAEEPPGPSFASSFDLAAEVGFYFLFSLFPFILFLMTMIRYLPIHVDAASLMAVGRDFLPDSIYALIIPPAVKTLVSPKGRLALPALLVCLWTASAAVSGLLAAVRRIYGCPSSRSYWRSKALSLVFTVVFGAALTAALLLLFLGPWLHDLLAAHLGFDWFWHAVLIAARWALVLGLMLLTVTAVYRCAPGFRRGRRRVSAGAIFAVAGWALTSKGFALYMAHSGRMNAFYGGLATLLALMSWLYLMALMVLLGAQLDRELSAQELEEDAPAAG
ncbi:MAG: YihY/virulence factor BrkB family protein [Elusimicrobia bacterium]|nr:YihY/virulence factor BrkB family protein [Elusimicrobiota bacterium]